MKKSVSVLIAAIITLSGCIKNQEMIYVNAHPEKHDFKKDRYECLQQSSQATPPATAVATDPFGNRYNYDVNEDNRNQLMEACMNARDWTLQPVPQVPKASISE